MIWKDVKGWEGIYQVNRLGQVRSLPRRCKIKNGSYRWTKGRFIKSFFAGDYLFYPFVKNGVNYTYYIHRLIAIYFKKNPLNLPEVNHKNGIKTDNRLSNLEWVTSKGNSSHAVRLGLTPNGERKVNAKLTEKQVVVIKKIKNESHSSVSKRYGVSPATISRIRNGTKWVHLN